MWLRDADSQFPKSIALSDSLLVRYDRLARQRWPCELSVAWPSAPYRVTARAALEHPLISALRCLIAYGEVQWMRFD